MSKPLKRITDRTYWAQIAAVGRRLQAGRDFCAEVKKNLPARIKKGVVMVNADTKEWFHAKNIDTGWTRARKRWGENIAGPPLWVIPITPIQVREADWREKK